MEYIPFDLTKLLETAIEEEDKKEAYLVAILYKCLRALEFIHSNKVMHRDIKPANILISDDNEITICDFGLSRSY